MLLVIILFSINLILIGYLLYDSSKCHKNFSFIDTELKKSDLALDRIEALEKRFPLTPLSDYDTIIANVAENKEQKSSDSTIVMVRDIQAKLDTILQLIKYTKIIKDSKIQSEPESELKP